ncbi:MAG: extracellular solute-binding protein [Kofleriaceae bacterium]|nr:extracellular solute-binding protein [Kofleriaceae bacterium]
MIAAMRHCQAWLTIGCVLGATACQPSEQPAPHNRVRLLHTFSPRQANHVAALLTANFADVDIVAVPFARARQVLRANLASQQHCPDVARIDATWLPELVTSQLLLRPPAQFDAAAWSAQAVAFASYHGQVWAVPHSIDGLVVARRPELPAPTAATLPALIAAIAQHSGDSGPRRPQTWPLQLRADGYWIVPWLRSEANMLQTTLPTATELAEQQPAIAHALASFAALFGDLAAPRPANGSEATTEAARFASGAIDYWIAGSWQLGELDSTVQLAVSALPQAPVGAQLFVVPRCAVHVARAWQLIAALTARDVMREFAVQDGLIAPAALPDPRAPQRVLEIQRALQTAVPLPLAPATALLFDDLGPALTAVVDHEASADEAAAGLVRGWTRMLAGAP